MGIFHCSGQTCDTEPVRHAKPSVFPCQRFRLAQRMGYKRHEIKGFILGACTKGYGYDQKAVTYTLADPVQDSLSLAIL